MFGVDEAGKGPVLGPMIVSAVAAEDASYLPDDVADSKTLSDANRARLANEIHENPNICVTITIVDTDEIDEANNMNNIVANAHARVISQLPASEKQGVVDASDTDEQRFAKNVTSKVTGDVADTGVTVIARHGADEENPFVAAASIIAKQKREDLMEKANESFEREIGSGYPSDPTTREFIKWYMKKYDDTPPIVRESWSTVDSIRDEL